MSIAIFAMRKIFLTKKVSDINFKLINLSQSLQNITNFGSTIGVQSSNINSGITAYQSGLYSSGNIQQDQFNFGMLLKYREANQLQQLQIKSAEDRIQTTRLRLETQLKMAQQELEQVEKGEEKAIKNGTPKYA